MSLEFRKSVDRNSNLETNVRECDFEKEKLVS